MPYFSCFALIRIRAPAASPDLIKRPCHALALARANVDYLGLQSRVRILESDLFGGLDGERYDIILSNPPYVDARDLAAMPAEYTTSRHGRSGPAATGYC